MSARQPRTFAVVRLLPLASALIGCASDDGAKGGSSEGNATGGATVLVDETGGRPSGGDPEGVASGGAPSGGAVAAGAPSGGTLGSGGDATNEQFPSDTSAEGIAAFLAAGTYRSWVHRPAPYPPGDLRFHGELMLAYFNEVAVATHDDAAIYAMTVKELYDAAGTQIGTAAALKTTEVTDRWTYYCMEDVPGTSCTNDSSAEYPVYEVEEFHTGCALCHGDAIISTLP